MKPHPRNAMRIGWGKFSIIIPNMIQAHAAARLTLHRTFAFAAVMSVWECLTPASAAAAPQQAAPERAVRSAVVTSTTEPITIDGVLDESTWKSAPKIGELIQRQP